jgi:hypothetical protein
VARFEKGHIPWSKGLTKEVEPRLAAMAVKVGNVQRGVPETDKTRKQLSEVVKKWHKEHPGVGKAGRLKQQKKRWLNLEQHEKASERIKGSNNYFWKGGIGKININYGGEFTYYLKRKVKNRDKWKCSICKVSIKNRILDVHHIDENKLNNSLNNLVTLCKSCHSKVHQKVLILEVF